MSVSKFYSLSTPIKLSQKDILFEFGHSTPNMNIAVAWKGPKERRRNVKIFQSQNQSGAFTSQALKFKLPDNF